MQLDWQVSASSVANTGKVHFNINHYDLFSTRPTGTNFETLTGIHTGQGIGHGTTTAAG